MSWKTCWTTVSCALIATVMIELTTHSFSRTLTTTHNAVHLKSTPRLHETTTNKPWFLLHVGPPKTATTTLQIELAKLNSSGVLEQADYMYLGRDSGLTESAPEFGTQVFRLLTNASCHVQVRAARLNNNTTTTIYPECWKELVNVLHELRGTGKHVILSDERFGFVDSRIYYDWQDIQDIFEREWNLQVIVSYRRYYDWIVSVKNQQYRENGLIWKWPHDGGAPPLPPLYESLQLMMLNSHPHKYLYTSTLLHKLNRYNISSSVFNMHHSVEKTTVLSTFTCQLAPTLCLYTSTNNTTTAETRSNAALNYLVYDGLVCQAAELGFINTTHYTRPVAAQMAQAFHQNVLNQTKVPLDCPTTLELMPLLQQSMDYEEEILPDFYKSSLGKTRLETDFWKAVQEHKFCSINAKATFLQQDVWRNFFQSLSNP